jgi:CheY-like chemotaxis protein
LSGWETLRKLKDDTEYNNIPVIMYSTSSSRKDIEIAYGLGARLFITKPEDFRELSKILEIVATGLGEEQISRLKEFASVRVNLN